MRTRNWLAIGLLAGAAMAAGAGKEPTQSEIDDIIQKFAAQESAFSKAREVYTYRQTARIQTLDPAGNTTGKWEQVSDIVFDSGNKRTERVVRAPMDTLKYL